MFEKLKELIHGQRVNIVEVDGNNEITRIRYIDGATRDVNQIRNEYDLLGYEIRSDTIELFSGKKFLGRGYIADLAGMTVDLSWSKPKDQIPEFSDRSPENHADEVLSIFADEIRDQKIPAWDGGKCQVVPCMVIEGSDTVKVIRFDYLREIDDAIIDDDRKIRYEKDPNTRLEIKMPDGKSGRGFVCSPSGKTIKIRRNVRVKIKIKELIEGTEISREEFTEVKFSGILGKLSSGDRLPNLLSGMSGRQNLIQLVIAFVAGAVIMAVF